MTKTTEVIEERYTVLGRRTASGELEFWSGYEFDCDIEDADCYAQQSPSDIIHSVIEISEELDCSPAEISIMKVERLLRVSEEIVVDDDRILEARRAKAISKLTTAEIEALGIGRYATYNKLKFHNAPEEDL